MKTNITQYAFTTGKMTGNVSGRNDIKQMLSGVKESINVIPLEQGPLEGRVGTEYICPARYVDKTTKLIPFKFSATQALMMEVGHHYMRFILEGAVVTTTYQEFIDLVDYTDNKGTMYSGDLLLFTADGSRWRVLDTDLNLEAVVQENGVWPEYYQLYTPFSEDIVDELWFTGEADIVYITHKTMPPHKLARYANNKWAVAQEVFNYGPFSTINTDITKKVKVTGTIAIDEIVTVTGLTSANIFNASIPYMDVVGRLFMIQVPATNLNDGGYMVGRIISVTSASVAEVLVLNTPVADIITKLQDAKGQITWRFGVFGPQVYTHTYHVTANTAAPMSVGFYRPRQGLSMLSISTRSEAWVHDNAILSADSTQVTSGYFMIYSKAGYWKLYAASTSAGVTSYTQKNYVGVAGFYPPRTGWTGAMVIGFETSNPTYLGTDWPGISCFHQQRLIYAGSVSVPDGLWFSEIAISNGFMPVNEQNELLDDSAFAYVMTGGEVNRIIWLASGPQLLVGTTGDEFVSSTSSESAPVTPKDISFVRQSARGSAQNQKPVLVGGTLLYVQRLGNIVRGMDYDVASGRFKSADLTKLSDTILSQHGGFKQVAYAPEPSSVVYYLTQTGKIVSLTYEPEDAVLAWSEYRLGGTGVVVQSIATLISDVGSYYDTYYLVDRAINGETKRYIEKSAYRDPDRNYWVFLDSAISYHEPDPLKTIALFGGLEHLEGQTVGILADGEYRGEFVVAGGKVSFGLEPEPLTDENDEPILDANGDQIYGTRKYNHVVVGLRYNCIVQLLPIETMLKTGSSVGKQKRTIGLFLQLDESLGVKVGPTLSKLDDVMLDSDYDLNTGIYPILVEEGFKTVAGDLFIVHEVPYPFKLVTTTREVEFRD